MGNREVEVKLLQFTDDTIFFCQANFKCILAIKAILRSFKVASCLKVIFHKSQVGVVVISRI